MNCKAKGIRFENNVVTLFRSRGYFSMRSPASLRNDVFATRGGRMYLVECTAEYRKRREKLERVWKDAQRYKMHALWAHKMKGKIGTFIDVVWEPPSGGIDLCPWNYDPKTLKVQWPCEPPRHPVSYPIDPGS